MKQILILILAFSLFSCSKDEKSNSLSSQKSKEEIFKAVIGTWYFNRLGYDPEFKKTEEVQIKECAAKDYTTLRSDGTITRISGCFDREETGTFRIEDAVREDDDNIYVSAIRSGLNLVPGWGRYEGAALYSYTDSTLVFTKFIYHSENGDIPNMYSELKRVK